MIQYHVLEGKRRGAWCDQAAGHGWTTGAPLDTRLHAQATLELHFRLLHRQRCCPDMAASILVGAGVDLLILRAHPGQKSRTDFPNLGRRLGRSGGRGSDCHDRFGGPFVGEIRCRSACAGAEAVEVIVIIKLEDGRRCDVTLKVHLSLKGV